MNYKEILHILGSTTDLISYHFYLPYYICTNACFLFTKKLTPSKFFVPVLLISECSSSLISASLSSSVKCQFENHLLRGHFADPAYLMLPVAKLLSITWLCIFLEYLTISKII